jgi:hypothetical protein
MHRVPQGSLLLRQGQEFIGYHIVGRKVFLSGENSTTTRKMVKLLTSRIRSGRIATARNRTNSFYIVLPS